MAGHSKWAQIKRKKARTDAEKGRIFTKLIREITVAARQGGGDEEANPRLRAAIAAAKAANMPAANIEKAIKRGTGELPGVVYEEVTYEGYGPGGVALLIQVVTDNRNRAVAEIRHILSKHSGSLGEQGSVAWMFERKGVVSVPKDGHTEEELLAIVLDAGVEDIREVEDGFELVSAPEDLEAVKRALDQAGISYESAEITMYPKSTVRVEGKEARQVLALLEALEEHDDVQQVFANFDIDESVMQEVESE
ncbi:MAG: YebC/PmpR family DNA-binding transcriptional regulator [candidate division KSB1 bacterium]|nr:YebC/PmpR family DNA-binding transcriptional regulator [candidate division KSB1 bacterium]